LDAKMLSLRSLINHLKEVHEYLESVCAGKLPLNHQILAQLQDIFNLSPNLNLEGLSKGFAIKTNDMLLVIYLSSLIRAVTALHSLINNKLDNRDAEKAKEQGIAAAGKEPENPPTTAAAGANASTNSDKANAGSNTTKPQPPSKSKK